MVKAVCDACLEQLAPFEPIIDAVAKRMNDKKRPVRRVTRDGMGAVSI